MTRTLCVVAAVLGLTSIVALGQAKPDPKILMGTWKMNVEKSTFNPGPGPKSRTVTWKPTATGFSFTFDAVEAQGQTTHAQQNGTFDGTPFAINSPTSSGTRTMKWLDAFTFEEVDTIEGKVRVSRTSVISKDGKTLTTTSKGMNRQGQTINTTTVARAVGRESEAVTPVVVLNAASRLQPSHISLIESNPT